MSPAPPPVDSVLAGRLHQQARCERWAVTVDRFRAALDASVAKHFAGRDPSPAEISAYLSALHLEDLALATACADGHGAAWDHFVLDVRPVLYRAADALDPSGGARELADGLYGELFGVKEAGGERLSLFRYFHGRSSLATWVRAVLSQRFVDSVRVRRKTDVLPDDDSPVALPAPRTDIDPERQRWLTIVQAALAAALAALTPRDRLRLGCYYAQQMKLAAIGRLLGEHEATVSRHLARTRQHLRDAVERRLRDDHQLDAAAIAECLATAADDVGAFDVNAVLGSSAEPARKDPAVARSREGGGRRVERT